MEKKYSTQVEKEVEWLKNEVEKDRIELDREKKEMIEQIKNYKKEEIVPKQKNYTLWERIKKVMMGS
jgi:hypothetical protein